MWFNFTCSSCGDNISLEADDDGKLFSDDELSHNESYIIYCSNCGKRKLTIKMLVEKVE